MRKVFFAIVCSAILSPLCAFPVEKLGRGTVCVATQEGNLVSWRLLGSDTDETSFDLYRDGQCIAIVESTQATCYLDKLGHPGSCYQVAVHGYDNTAEGATPWVEGYLEIPLNAPEGYFPCEASAGDLDGDGEYELVLKWDPPHPHDNSHSGFTEEVLFDAYRLDGTQLWRIQMGQNIRAGAHYTQFVVFDLDGDGKAEVAMRTAPGTIDGAGNYVLLPGDDPKADYRRTDEEMPGRAGYIVRGPEYLTVFDGETGTQRATCPFEPARGEVSDWGDNYGNRVDRFLAAAAQLGDGNPSIIMGRGYYQQSAVAAFDLQTEASGKETLSLRWLTMGNRPGEGIYAAGNHNWSVGDIDNDGFDEIIHGACALDHDGKVLYNTGLGHGDAIHVGKIDPSRPGLQVMTVHEEKAAYETHGMEVHDALTGEILWGIPASGDNGRGCAADIDPRYPGWECWSIASQGLYDCQGNLICENHPRSINFRIYWDGDALDELLDKGRITKWDTLTQSLTTIFTLEGCQPSNGSKSTPVLQADLLGDWREEIIMAVKGDPSKLRIYSTPIPTKLRRTCLMHDNQYRKSIVWQNCAYNQPPHVGE